MLRDQRDARCYFHLNGRKFVPCISPNVKDHDTLWFTGQRCSVFVYRHPWPTNNLFRVSPNSVAVLLAMLQDNSLHYSCFSYSTSPFNDWLANKYCTFTLLVPEFGAQKMLMKAAIKILKRTTTKMPNTHSIANCKNCCANFQKKKFRARCACFVLQFSPGCRYYHCKRTCYGTAMSLYCREQLMLHNTKYILFKYCYELCH